MNTYTFEIEALQPLRSGVPESRSAPAIAAGEVLKKSDVALAIRQHRGRESLQSVGLVTGEEVVEALDRIHRVQSANFDGPTPDWALQMQQQFQQQSQQMQQQFQQMSAAMRAAIPANTAAIASGSGIAAATSGIAAATPGIAVPYVSIHATIE